MKNLKSFAFFAFLFCILFNSNIFAEPTAADRGFAADEFRRGVQSFYRGSYNDAILLFEKALSYVPNDSQVLEWLGNSYYQAGIEGAAIQYWKDALKNNYSGDALLLQNKIDMIEERRVVGNSFETSARYVEAGAFPGREGENFYYNLPISALSENDGGCWIVAYGSNELLRFDANGQMIARIRGPVNGFDSPMDIIRSIDGKLLVSEYAGDRIAVLNKDGSFIKTFGTKGRKNGELLGPQYMDIDSSGNIYVTDFGNARVAVFNNDGEGLFTFGTKQGNFEGFKAPSGIAIVQDVVYVADAVIGTIYMFDTAGNYLDNLVPNGTFKQAESLKHWNNYLLLADSNRVYAINVADGSLFECVNTGNAPSRLTCAVPDVNGNLLVTDFKSNEVFVMSKMAELVGGLFVQIIDVNTDKFPHIKMDVRVENRQSKAIVGLKDSNFLITENKRPVLNQQLTGISSNNQEIDISIVVDRSLEMAKYREALQSAVRDIAQSMNGKGTLHIVSAGELPVLEASGNPSQFIQFTPGQLKSALSSNTTSDLAIRLGANKLITGEKKRAIIYISAGEVSTNAFNSYGLADISSYLNNNGISFVTVNLSRNKVAPEIEFLTKQTAGDEYYIFRPNGITMLIDDLLETPTAFYELSFTTTYSSNTANDFGRRFLPVEVETYLLNRSGRAESGYFAPLQ